MALNPASSPTPDAARAALPAAAPPGGRATAGALRHPGLFDDASGQGFAARLRQAHAQAASARDDAPDAGAKTFVSSISRHQ